MMGIVGCLELFERFANYHDYDSGKHEKAKDKEETEKTIAHSDRDRHRHITYTVFGQTSAIGKSVKISRQYFRYIY